MNVDVYQFESAPAFLKQVLKEEKRRRMSLRSFSKKAGIKSPATLSLIVSGQRIITPEMEERLSDVLQLHGRRRKYFGTLCRLTQAQKSEDSFEVKEELFRQRSIAIVEPIKVAHYRFLTHWYYVALYVLIGLPEFDPNPELLARKIGNGVTAREIDKALKDLETLGMLIREDGKFRQGMGHVVKTSEDVRNLAIQTFHRQMALLAIRSLNRPVEDRELTSLTVAVAPEQMPSIKEKIRKFREELDQFIESGKRRKRVYQMNIQFFPLTNKD